MILRKKVNVLNLLQNAYQMILFLQQNFSTSMVNFFDIELEILQTLMHFKTFEKVLFLKENVFIIFEGRLKLNGRAENMRVVPGFLVLLNPLMNFFVFISILFQ